jgi:hypothetical protein
MAERPADGEPEDQERAQQKSAPVHESPHWEL